MITSRFFSRLRVGDVIEQDGEEWIVDLVNPCRARIKPLRKRQVSYETLEGKKVEFEASRKWANISPQSEVPILRRGYPVEKDE